MCRLILFFELIFASACLSTAPQRTEVPLNPALEDLDGLLLYFKLPAEIDLNSQLPDDANADAVLCDERKASLVRRPLYDSVRAALVSAGVQVHSNASRARDLTARLRIRLYRCVSGSLVGQEGRLTLDVLNNDEVVVSASEPYALLGQLQPGLRGEPYLASAPVNRLVKRLLSEPHLARLRLYAKPRAASKATGPVLAVFEIEDPGRLFSSLQLRQIEQYLSARLTEAASYRIVPPGQVKRRLNDIVREGYGPCYDEHCQIEIGRALAAEQSMSVRVFKQGEACTLALRVFDLAQGLALHAATAEAACDGTALFGAVDQAVESLKIAFVDPAGRAP